ncbi:MAG: DUF2797 domain-containing protein [Proteobacteria bacterium]|nr:DUF2797 domain-containing protein [Pseudomonadota bacterium]
MKTSCPVEGGMVDYTLVLNDEAVLQLNSLLGKEISICYTGQINCIHCKKQIKKTIGQGSCWDCYNKLACNDMCILKPETCHFAKGTCRQPEWGEKNCFRDHTLYLSRSAGIKIGITKGGNHLIRWADQGAVEATIIGKFKDRLQVGLAEKAISSGGIGDKTSWQKMLKNDVTDEPFDGVFKRVQELLSTTQRSSLLTKLQPVSLEYPHLEWPRKVKSMKMTKVPKISGVLTAIKGQYLMFGDRVINIRSHSGYEVNFNY